MTKQRAEEGEEEEEKERGRDKNWDESYERGCLYVDPSLGCDDN